MATDRLIVFGGYDLSPCCAETNDVWVLENATGSGGVPSWVQLTPTAAAGLPQSRQAHSAVYDPATNRMIIFGGGRIGGGHFSSLFNDVWVLTHANGLGGTPEWIPLTPSGGPPAPREGHAAFYNHTTNEMFVFGGGDNGIMSVPGDLWALENANGIGTPGWIQLAQTGAAPGPLQNFASAYDLISNRITIVGGCCGYTNATRVLALNRPAGTPQWTNLSPGGTPPSAGDGLVYGYNQVSNRMIVHGMLPGGGSNTTSLLTDANALGGTPMWADITPQGTPAFPPDRVGSVYNAATNKLIHAVTRIDTLGNLVPEVWVLSNADGNVTSTFSSQLGVAGSPTNPVVARGEPVSTATGNYYYQHADLAIPGRGIPLVFQRSYNSLDSYSGPLGANWTHTYNVALTATATSAIIKWGDGHGETFTLSGSTYIAQPGVFSTLTKNADGTFVLARKDQTRFNFASSGKLASIRDKNSNTLTLTYDGSGNLTQITDTVGRNLTLSYDGSNRIAQVIDPISRAVSFQYDGNNNLVQASDPAGGITTFAYDSNHGVTSITQPNGQTLLTNVYDASGRVITQTGGRGFSGTFAYDTPNPGETTFTDARGNQTVDSYDSSLRIVKITDAASGTTSFTYDGNNDRMSVTNQNGKTTNFSYDSVGNITGITDSLGNSTSFTYDAKNDLLTATNPKAKTTTFSYDANGNLKNIQDALTNLTTFGYDGFGELTSKTDARGNATSYSYDSQGNLTRITDALSHNTGLAYDGIGRLTSITDPNSHAASSTYDALSRLTKIADPLGNQTQFVYDAVGNLLKITDANGHATNYVYDAMNNLLSVTDALSHVTQYAYDANNNRITFTNAKGNATSYAYDPLNRLSRITDPLSFVTSYSYDSVGNVLAVLDAKGQNNQFTYDALNRLLGIAYADGKSVAYSYDANGNRTSMADSHGTTTYSYDSLDRLTSVTNPGAKVVSYSYDGVGNRKSLTYPDGKVVNYSFDAANRLSAATDWLGRNTAYAYDAASNLTRTAYPNGASIAFAFDAANRLLQVVNNMKSVPALTLGYTLDAVGNRSALSANGVTTNFSYDQLNELVAAQLGSLKSTWAYDTVGNRLTQTSPLGSIAYTYDADDRLLSAGSSSFVYDANGNQISKTQTATGQPIVYAYDAANRLTNVVGGVFTSSFAYDGDGNRFGQTTSRGTYNYLSDVATALPVVLQESGPDGNISYAYGLGLISESSPTFNYFYHYDGLGSVIALTDASGSPKAGYAYDPWGNPLINVTDSVGTKNKFRFTGEALDPGTQLYYLRARYYEPNVARFFSRDPFSGLAGDPLTINKYLYVLNRPVTFSDPSGLAAEKMAGAGDAFTPITNFAPALNNANSTIATAPKNTAANSAPVDTAIAVVCKVVGFGEAVFEKTWEFIAGHTLNYVYSNGGTQPVSDVPCYSQVPGVGLFFTSVPTAQSQ